jgi:tricorn protease interacting factor F2/3
MDQPAMKASFDVEMVLDRSLKAISNEIVLEEKKAGEGKKVVKFRRTPRMSTYLVFLGLGDFEIVRDVVDPRVAVVTLPGSTRYGKYGAKFGRMALHFCEEYFQIPYPLPKMDLIAVPDFAFGAMENWGAITFRENLLLFYSGTTSKAGEQRICEVIAHEIVHQWFGNLVTPSDWKYLWLNESFATYFAYRIVDSYYPQWDTWGQFLVGQTDSAMSRDQLTVDQAIEIPGGEHVVINSSTAPIIYSKGGSILRQVEGYIGKEAFRKGLNRYLTRYAYDNAASEDLWKSFEEASHKPVTAMMQNWVEQPGYPIVEVDRREDVIVLTQKRFTCLPNESDQAWLIPLAVRIYGKNGDSRLVEMLMDGKTAHIDLGDDAVAYKVNSEQTGFYRTRYLNPDDLSALGTLVAQKKLGPFDRWGLQNDLFALVRSGDLNAFEYTVFLSHYKEEDEFLPLTSIASNLHHLYAVLDGDKRTAVEEFGAEFAGEVLARIGHFPTEDEPVTISILRDRLLWHACLYGDEEAQKFVAEKFYELARGKEIHADITKAVLQASARQEKEYALGWMKEKFRSSKSEHERMNVMAGLACFDDTDLIRKALQFVLDEIPSRNKFMPIGAMGINPEAEPLIWDWFVENLEELEKMHPLHFERVISGVVPVGGIERADQVTEFLAVYMEKNPKFKDAIKLSLERLELNRRLRKA